MSLESLRIDSNAMRFQVCGGVPYFDNMPLDDVLGLSRGTRGDNIRLLGYFPWYNVSVVAAPIANLAFLSLWNRLRRRPLLYASLFYMTGACCALLVIVVYVIVEKRPL